MNAYESLDAGNSGGALNEEQWQEYVLHQVDDTFKAVGQEVDSEDPEWPKVAEAFKTPQSLAQLLHAIRMQAELKKSRLAGDKSTAEARVGGGSGRLAGGAQMTTHDLWARAYKK